MLAIAVRVTSSASSAFPGKKWRSGLGNCRDSKPATHHCPPFEDLESTQPFWGILPVKPILLLTRGTLPTRGTPWNRYDRPPAGHEIIVIPTSCLVNVEQNPKIYPTGNRRTLSMGEFPGGYLNQIIQSDLQTLQLVVQAVIVLGGCKLHPYGFVSWQNHCLVLNRHWCHFSLVIERLQKNGVLSLFQRVHEEPWPEWSLAMVGVGPAPSRLAMVDTRV